MYVMFSVLRLGFSLQSSSELKMESISVSSTEADLVKLMNLVLKEWLRSRAQEVSRNKKDLVER